MNIKAWSSRTYSFDYEADLAEDVFDALQEDEDYLAVAQATIYDSHGTRLTGHTAGMYVSRPSSFGHLWFHMDVQASPSGIAVNVTCTNTWDEAENVTAFQPWGFEPKFSVETPSGTTYTAANEYNISLVATQVLLSQGCSVTRIYDLLGSWRKQEGGGLVSGKRSSPTLANTSSRQDTTPTWKEDGVGSRGHLLRSLMTLWSSRA